MKKVKVKLEVYPIRLKPETVDGLRVLGAAERRPWSQYLRNLAEDAVAAVSKLRRKKN